MANSIISAQIFQVTAQSQADPSRLLPVVLPLVCKSEWKAALNVPPMTTQSLTAPMPIPQHRSSRTDHDSSSSHNSLSASPSSTSSSQSNQSYRELVKQITSQAPKPYGAIPPLIGRHKRKKRKKDDAITSLTATDNNTSRSSEEPLKAMVAIRINDQETPTSPRKPPLPRPMRSMSHVENWVAVDSKESLPDEEELVSKM